MAARCLSRLLLLAVAALLLPSQICLARQIIPKESAEAAQKQQQLPVLPALQAAAAIASKGALISVPAATTAPPTSSCDWNGATYLEGTWTFCPQCQDYSYCYCCNGAWTHCGSSQDWQVTCYNGIGTRRDWHDDRIMIVDPPLARDWTTNPGHIDDHHHDDDDQISDHHDHDEISDHHEDQHHDVQGSVFTNSGSHDNTPATSFGGWDHHDSLSNPGASSFGSDSGSIGFSGHDHGSSSFGGSSNFGSHDFGSSSFGGGGFSSHDFGGSSFGGGHGDGGGGHHGRKLLHDTRH